MEPAVSSKTRTVIKILRIIVVLVVAAAAALVLVKTRPHPARQEAESKAPLVDVLQARSVSPNMVIHAYGTINSGQNLDLVAQVGGSITEMSPGKWWMKIIQFPGKYSSCNCSIEDTINYLGATPESLERQGFSSQQ